MRSERLSTADLSALAFEGAETPMHVVAIMWLEAGPLLDGHNDLQLDMVRREVEGRLPWAPRLRQVVAGSAFWGARWIDAEPFDIARHVVATALPPPGSEEQLLELVARSFMTRLDRDRPLWELRLVSGLRDGRVAALLKLHHAIADGPAAVRLLASLFDMPAAALPPAPPALTGNARSDAIERMRSGIGGAKSALAALAPAPRTSLDRPVGMARRFALVRLDLAEARRAAHARGGKVNDVVLALAAAGARAILCERGESVAGGELRASIFVGLRQQREDLGNATGVLTVAVPIDETDPKIVLDRVIRATTAAKRQQPAAGIAAITFFVTRIGLGRALYRHQRQVNLFVTNVVGPTAPVEALGAKVEDIAVMTPLGGNVALTFAALSYAGRLNVSIIGDAEGCPEVNVAACAMSGAWDAMREATAVGGV